MNKKNIKKIIFYITLIPYLYVLIMCLFNFIVGLDTKSVTGSYLAHGLGSVDQYLRELGYTWCEICLNPIGILLLLLWISYQLYYFITFKSNKANKNISKKYTSNINILAKINVRKILFYIAVLCWVIYFLYGVYAFFFGYDAGWFNENMLYGSSAMLYALILAGAVFSVIPVLPISLLYIIIYLANNKKNKEK